MNHPGSRAPDASCCLFRLFTDQVHSGGGASPGDMRKSYSISFKGTPPQPTTPKPSRKRSCRWTHRSEWLSFGQNHCRCSAAGQSRKVLTFVHFWAPIVLSQHN